MKWPLWISASMTLLVPFILAEDASLEKYRVTQYPSGSVSSLINKCTDSVDCRIWFFPSGRVNMINYFKNGKKDGKSFTFFESGEIESEQEFRLDRIHGTQTFFYKNGSLRYQAKYNENVRIGQERSYAEDGTVFATGSYKDGERYNGIFLANHYKFSKWVMYSDGNLVGHLVLQRFPERLVPYEDE